MKTIELTLGKVALVDDDDYERVSQYAWQAVKRSAKHPWYATGNFWTERGRRATPMHRFIMQPAVGMVVDHIDGNGLNNQRSNLRICTQAENIRNSRQFGRSRTQFKGVTANRGCHTNPWRAQIQVDGKKEFLGVHATQEDAAQAYNFAADRHFGRFARLNEVPQPWLDDQEDE